MSAQNLVNICLFLILLIIMTVNGDVSDYYRYNQPESAQLSRPTPYPAAGFRPNRIFNLPNDSERNSETRQPNAFYNAPINQQQQQQHRQQHRQQQPQQQQESIPQRTYLAPDHNSDINSQSQSGPQRQPQSTYLAPVPTMKTKPARLVTNREEQDEDVEDFAASEIEVNIDMKTTKASDNQLGTTTLAALAYYPIAPIASYYQIQPAAYTTGLYGQLQSAPLITALPAAYNQYTNQNTTTTTSLASAQQRSSKLSSQQVSQATLNLPLFQIW